MAIEEMPGEERPGPHSLGDLDRLDRLDRLDSLIDGVACGMTSAEPSDRLRPTVLLRVSSPDGWGTGLRPWAVAAVAAAVLVVAVAQWRADRSSGSGPTPQVARLTPPSGQPGTPASVDERPGAADDADASGLTVASRDGDTARQVLAADMRDSPDNGDTVGIAPLEVTPLAIAFLQPVPVEMDGVEIQAVPAPAAVVIGEIDVVPLRLGEAEYGLVE